MDTSSNDTPTVSNKPAYIAYHVRERGEGKKAIWTELGVAFPHKDVKGFDVLCDVSPHDGRITLRLNRMKGHALRRRRARRLGPV